MINLKHKIEDENDGDFDDYHCMDTSLTMPYLELDELDSINDSIQKIEDACNTINNVVDHRLNAFNAVSNQNRIFTDTNKLIQVIRKQMEQAKKKHLTDKISKNATEIAMFGNKFQSLLRFYQVAVKRYEQTKDAFKEKALADVCRRAKIMHPEHTQAQIQKMIDPELQQMDENCSKVEENVAEIQALFNALLLLLIDSGETLDEIEMNMDETLQMTKKGKDDIDKARHYVNEKRKCVIHTLIAIAILISVPFVFIILITLNQKD